MSNRVRIVFQLIKDLDGYPPADRESLWARRLGGKRFQIDNIPFFVKGIAVGDTIAAIRKGKEWHFESLLEASCHSTVRLVFLEPTQQDAVLCWLTGRGCAFEGSHLQKLISVDIPAEVPISDVFRRLDDWWSQDVLDYEVGTNRQRDHNQS